MHEKTAELIAMLEHIDSMDAEMASLGGYVARFTELQSLRHACHQKFKDLVYQMDMSRYPERWLIEFHQMISARARIEAEKDVAAKKAAAVTRTVREEVELVP